MRPSKLSQAGDTIIEVLIAIAIISSVLGIAYGSMNRNMQIMRDNQERSEATRIAQGQLEALKNFWSNRKSDITSKASDGFCIVNNSIPTISGGSPSTSTGEDLNNYQNTSITGVSCTSSYYNFGIKQFSGNTYVVYVRYDQIGRGARSEVRIVYRLP